MFISKLMVKEQVRAGRNIDRLCSRQYGSQEMMFLTSPTKIPVMAMLRAKRHEKERHSREINHKEVQIRCC